jgi:hypothetical protein
VGEDQSDVVGVDVQIWGSKNNTDVLWINLSMFLRGDRCVTMLGSGGDESLILNSFDFQCGHDLDK